MYRLYDNNISVTNAAYTPAGTWNLSEPAIQVVHADGNTSLELLYDSHQTRSIENNVVLTEILLRDSVYPFEVILFYKAFQKENVIEQWVEIIHHETKSVKLEKYASANLYFTAGDFFLTSYHNLWAKEMQPTEEKLIRGSTTIESKLGARAMLLESSSFILSFGSKLAENQGDVLLGHLGWAGNFKLEFEVDGFENLRLLAGINPYASEYFLEPDISFATPPLIYALSSNGA
jgi:alpha-galactosidase